MRIGFRSDSLRDAIGQRYPMDTPEPEEWIGPRASAPPGKPSAAGTDGPQGAASVKDLHQPEHEEAADHQGEVEDRKGAFQ